MEADWNPDLYRAEYSFVWEKASGLIDLLAPREGEAILDAGCGTGQLTAAIAARGARVTGADRSPAMIESARQAFPELRFVVADVTALPFDAAFDGVFSNAALHWIKDAHAAARSLARALRTGGRLVAEFGGHGNVAAVMAAMNGALRSLGNGPVDPWYFPSVAEYAAVLERNGFEVAYAALFPRMTALDGTLAGWVEMFGGAFLAAVPVEQRAEFLRDVERRAAPELHRHGRWWADYRRLRIAASRVR